MVDVPLARGDYFRGVAKEARIRTRNRYYESNPVLTDTGVAMISRPGLRRGFIVGDGPIRGLYTQPGSFDDCLFVASGIELWRIETDGTSRLLLTGLQAGTSSVSMAATGNIGTTPEFLFVADGTALFVYVANGYANNRLEGTPANNDVVQIGTSYYKFTNASVDAGTPLGTVGNPWLVALGAGAIDAFDNLRFAIGDVGIPGTQYSTVLTPNDSVIGFSSTALNMTVRAISPGTIGNGIATTETGAALAWAGGATLTGGGADSVLPIQTPDDVGIISLGYIASYVVAVPAQGQGINGRFFWIEPGEITIDPLNFATAERAPDPVSGVAIFGDNFWLPGIITTEVWNFTGDIDAPVARLRGITFDRGAWEGTALQVKESMIIVDSDGGVFQVSGGIKPIASPAIAQQIREAMQKQASFLY